MVADRLDDTDEKSACNGRPDYDECDFEPLWHWFSPLSASIDVLA